MGAVDLSGDYDSVTLSAEGQTIVVSSIALTRGQTTKFKWTGAIQNTAGIVSLVSQSKLTSTGSLGDLSTPPTVTAINAAPCTGAISVAGISEVTSGSSGNQLVFDYAPTGTMDGGELILTVPSGWTAPQVTAAGTAGYTTAASTGGVVGTLTVIDQVVTIPVTSLASGQSIRVRYGSGSGSSGAVAQGITGYANFEFSSKGKSDDTASNVGRGTIYVTNASDGSGSAAVTPASISAGSTQDIDIVFTAAGNMDGGKVSFTAPAGWSAFSKTSGSAGYATTSVDSDTSPTTSVSDGNLVGGVLEVTIATLGASESFTVNYDNVVVPSATGSYSFGVKSQASASGSLVDLTTGPSVTVGAAADGSGTATVASIPTSVGAGSVGNSVTITYTAVGPIAGGAVTVAVPAGWTAPAAGNTTVASSGTIGALSFDAQTAAVDGVTLAATQTITFTFAGMTAQPAAGEALFTLQSKGSPTGTLTAAATANLTIANAADGSGSLVISPEAVISGSTQDVTITYTSAGSISGGGLQIPIPTGWSEPQASTPAGEGFVNAYAAGDSASDTIGIASVSAAGVITVPITRKEKQKK